jgi:hypothetical protein
MYPVSAPVYLGLTSKEEVVYVDRDPLPEVVEQFLKAWEWRKPDGKCVNCGAGRLHYHLPTCKICIILDPYVKRLLAWLKGEEEEAA